MHTSTRIASSSWIFAYLDVLLVIVPIYALYSLENLVNGPYYAYSTYLHSIRLETQKLQYKNMPYWAQESCRGNPEVLMAFSHALARSERLSQDASRENFQLAPGSHLQSIHNGLKGSRDRCIVVKLKLGLHEIY